MAVKFGAALTQALGDRVQSVAQLGLSTEVEILDIDPIASKEEVLAALCRTAIETSMTSTISPEDIKITDFWTTRSGNQIAITKVPRSVANTVTRIPVGWVMCRVRPKTKVERCYRCHGFGHTTNNCAGPDLTEACRRCGQQGHLEKVCNVGEDRCVACEQAGYEKAEHKPGSGRCRARHASLVLKTARSQ